MAKVVDLITLCIVYQNKIKKNRDKGVCLSSDVAVISLGKVVDGTLGEMETWILGR